MRTVSLNLIVLRVSDLEVAVTFYSTLGLTFTKHAHGKGPEHYAANLGSLVFELYPLSPDSVPTKGLRLGFHVEDATTLLQHLAQQGATVISPLKASPWGLRAVLDDPFGHRLELVQVAA